jgi:hypothetical protein
VSENNVQADDSEFITLRRSEWSAYQAYVKGIERRVQDYEADELRREEYNRERSVEEAAQKKRLSRTRGVMTRITALYLGGWVFFALGAGSLLLFGLSALPGAIDRISGGDVLGWATVAVLGAVLVLLLMVAGYQRIRRPLAVFAVGLLGPLLVWGLVYLGSTAGIVTILPMAPPV